jgi:uncharacterized membrane protein
VVLFSILGAALMGSGIILLLAHNWDQLSRVMRTVISFAPLVCEPSREDMSATCYSRRT